MPLACAVLGYEIVPPAKSIECFSINVVFSEANIGLTDDSLPYGAFSLAGVSPFITYLSCAKRINLAVLSPKRRKRHSSLSV